MIPSSGPASSDDIPFAAAPNLRPSSNDAYVPSLSEITQFMQLKHIKLWQAGAAPNWRLATFAVDQIRDMFLRMAIFYRDIRWSMSLR